MTSPPPGSAPLLLSVVVPAYNEARALPALVANLRAVLADAAGGSYEIIVSDDGSTDGTALLAGVDRGDGRIRVVRSERNRGKGAALRAGTAESRGEFILFCDADMCTPPGAVGRFLDALSGGAHAAIGNRLGEDSVIVRPQPLLRRLLGRGFRALAGWASGVAAADYNCGFKLFRGPVARSLLAETRVEGWSIDVEILSLAAARGLSVVEVPVEWSHGEESKVRLLPAVWGTLRELRAIRRRARKR